MSKTLEKHFDETYKREYYFDPEANQSYWELPTDQEFKIVDKIRPKSKKELEDEKKRKEYKEKQERIKALQAENMKEMGIEEQRKEEFEEQLEKFEEAQELKRQEALQKPARRQVQDMKKETAYVEGNYDYNIWYDKFLTDRNAIVEKAPSLTRCKPMIDSGYTKADTFQKKNAQYFCAYFARGCCSEGTNCRFYHRIPSDEDSELAMQDNLRDIFGRARHATFKEDFTGVGSFNKECRTLLVENIQLPKDQVTSSKEMVKLIYEQFSEFGKVEDIHYNSKKNSSFILFTERFYAEFAREAMLDQVLTSSVTTPLTIKWAVESPFDRTQQEPSIAKNAADANIQIQKRVE